MRLNCNGSEEMLGLNWGVDFYKHDLNQRNRKIVLLLLLDAAARNGLSLEEKKICFDYLEMQENSFLCPVHMQNNDHIFFLVDLHDSTNDDWPCSQHC